jgi:tRNA A37 threonylcarbamoyladenosine dehydratase
MKALIVLIGFGGVAAFVWWMIARVSVRENWLTDPDQGPYADDHRVP